MIGWRSVRAIVLRFVPTLKAVPRLNLGTVSIRFEDQHGNDRQAEHMLHAHHSPVGGVPFATRRGRGAPRRAALFAASTWPMTYPGLYSVCQVLRIFRQAGPEERTHLSQVRPGRSDELAGFHGKEVGGAPSPRVLLSSVLVRNVWERQRRESSTMPRASRGWKSVCDSRHLCGLRLRSLGSGGAS